MVGLDGQLPGVGVVRDAAHQYRLLHATDGVSIQPEARCGLFHGCPVGGGGRPIVGAADALEPAIAAHDQAVCRQRGGAVIHRLAGVGQALEIGVSGNLQHLLIGYRTGAVTRLAHAFLERCLDGIGLDHIPLRGYLLAIWRQDVGLTALLAGRSLCLWRCYLLGQG